MFYQGYGQTSINHDAIAYYRYDRIVSDLVDDCDMIFLSQKGEGDRKELLEDIKSMFLPDGKIETAYRSDRVFQGS